MELVAKGWRIGRGMVRREAVMATKFEKPLEASQVTHVADMPPLEVVTEGIPAQEHIEAPPTAQPEAAPERRRHTLAWALAGAIGLLLVVAGIFAFAQNSPTSTPDLHMGLTPQAWQEFRAGERASTTPFHMGLNADAWRAYRSGERAVAALAPMGLTPQAWQEFRAGERASTTPFHMGLNADAWRAYRSGERAA
jgi:hypothetical protein